LKLWACKLADRQGVPGQVLAVSDEGLLIACGGGAVLVTELQRAGGRRLGAREFLRGFPVSAGEQLAASSP
jgi:methionyl-tRNA formyltransferase